MIWAGGCSTRCSGIWRPKGSKIATGTIVAAVTIAAVGEILRPRRLLADRGPLTAIGLIAPNTGFLAMQQFGQDPAVGDIGRCRHHRMDQLGSAVDAQMRLHAEIPVVALLRLMHLGIARLGRILRRR